MSRERAGGQTHPPQLVLGFGDLSESSIRRGIKTVADLLQTVGRRPRRRVTTRS